MAQKDLFAEIRERERHAESQHILRMREELRPAQRSITARIQAQIMREYDLICPLYVAQLGRIVGRNSPELFRSISDVAAWIVQRFSLQRV